MRRYTIRNLMALMVVTALGLAALRNANEWWAGAMLLFAIAALGIAMAGAVIMRGRERCWWAGFACFAGGYLALTSAPGLSAEVGPRLATTTALHHLYTQFTAYSPEPRLPHVLWWQHEQALKKVESLKANNRGPGDSELESTMRILINLERQLRGAADERDFIRVGHALFALLAGLMGGTVALWFYRRRERAGA